MIGKVILNGLLVRLGIDEFVQRPHVKVLADGDHPIVPSHQFLLEFDPEVVNVGLNHRGDLLVVERHVWQQLSHLLLAHFVADHGLDPVLVYLFIQHVQDLLKPVVVVLKHVVHKLDRLAVHTRSLPMLVECALQIRS